MSVPFPDGVGFMDNATLSDVQWQALYDAHYGGQDNKLRRNTRADTLRVLRSRGLVAMAGLDLTARGRDLIRWHEEGLT